MNNDSTNKKHPDVKISCISNVYTRMMHFKSKNIVEIGHKHFYDHSMLLATGSVSIKMYDPDLKEFLPEVKFTAPATIFIKKGMVHQIESLEDNTIAYCVHALRDETENIIDPSMFPVPSSLMETIEKYFHTTNKDLIPPILLKDEFSDKRIIREENIFDKF